MKTSDPKFNVTVWMQSSAVIRIDDIAENCKRTRNYVMAKFLEGLTSLPTEDLEQLLLEIGLTELLPLPKE